METLNSFCGLKNNSFKAWDSKIKDFGPCFENLVIVCPSNVLLLFTSAYLIGRKPRISLRDYSLPLLIKLRVILSCFVFTESLAEIICSILLENYHPPSYLFLNSLICLTWIFNSFAIWKLRYLFLTKTCLPQCHLIATTLVFVASGFQIYSVIIHVKDLHGFDNSYLGVKEYGTITRSILQLMYLMSVFSCNTLRVSDDHSFPSFGTAGIQAQDESEREALLRSISHGTFYSSTQCVTDDLGVAEDQSNIFSKLSFWWVRSIMIKGYKGHIQTAEDLFMLPNSLRTDNVQNRFSKELYHKEPVSAPEPRSPTSNSTYSDFDDSGSNIDVRFSTGEELLYTSTTVKRSLLGALHHCFGWQYYSLGLLKLLGDGLGFAGPLLLHALVSFMENTKEPIVHGYYYASGLLLTTLLVALINSQFSYLVNKIGLQMRAAIITSVYQKALSVSITTLAAFSSGEVVNFMSTDTDRVVNFCPSFHQFWSLPFQIAVSLYLLHQQVGLAFLAGLCFAILLIPVNRWLAIRIQALSKDMMLQKDNRVKMMIEILYGIRVIKFYAWEENFKEKIAEVRAAELKSLKGRKYLDAWCVYFWATTPVIISILTFTTYALMGNTLTAAKVFTSVALFNMLISPLNAFPWVLNGLMEAWVSVKRLQAFLALDDLDLDGYYVESPPTESGANPPRTPNIAIKVVDGHFTWRYKFVEENEENSDDREDQSTNTPETRSAGKLSHINLAARKGQLIGIIGTVGSGKSSLLSALTAEMDKLRGQVFVAGLESGFGLAAQEPWIQHATVKENILFGKPYDVDKYSAVIRACALQEDLRILPTGDETEVGENGVTLSGGQKARVALARAVYQNKDMYLLDDPLAAVDAHVAAHLFQHCIMGILRNKTVILCTHHTKFLTAADLVLVMDHGTIMHCGSPEEILDKENIMRQISRDESRDSTEEDNYVNVNQLDEDKKKVESAKDDGGLVTEEERDVGAVKFHVYGSYWLAIGHCLATSILLSLLLMQASRNLSDWWLAYWISHTSTKNSTSHADNDMVTQAQRGTWHVPITISDRDMLGKFHVVKNSVTFYLIVYAGFAVANTIFTLFRAFLFAYGGIRAAKIIHTRLLNSILSAPVAFFDITPIGRIINRFSSDMYSIDDSLPFILNIFLAQAYGVAGTIVITCYGLPWLTILLLPLALIYYYIQNYYRRTSRELKRLMSVTLSPIYAHFSETLTGLSTIRALREAQWFKSQNVEKLEVNQRANFCAMAASQWLSLRLQFLGVAMVTGVAFIAVLEHHFNTVDPGLVGLAISYALSVTDRLSGMVSSFTETEKQMVSVERAVQYIENVPAEPSGRRKLSPSWPAHGCISFHNVVLVYRPGLPAALRGVSFQTTAGEKVGIVGRTGSGKSSLFLLLFRLVDVQDGVVVLDGVNVASLPLNALRSRLAIIPQDPFLFSGSVRDNVDPWNRYSDIDLWTTLERCHLDQPVRDLGGLDAEVGERGRHFSVGQRQLMCLVRALLTRAKVLCIDEATASVDMATDRVIQQTIREEFRHSTVLTIAHRIDTIMDSDRVLVMDRGTVAEFDSPAELLADRRSLFYSLVHNS